MKLGFHIAVRFLRSNRGQTLLIILGIAIGVSVQIFIGSLIQGLQKSLIDKTIGDSPQITITSSKEDPKISANNDFMKIIQDTAPSITDIAVVLDNAAFLEYKNNSQSLLVRGFQLDQADGIYNIKNRILEGRIPEADNEIILGIALQEEYGIQLNDTVQLTTPNQKHVDCNVVGFFDFQVSSLNNNWGITTLETAQTIFETGDYISSIEIQVTDSSVFAVDEISSDLKRELNQEDLEVSNWKEQNEALLSGLQGQSISSYIIQVFVMISVVLGIASVLAITVLQKAKQIGILKAMGIRNSTTGYVFLFEGLLLGFFGTILGIALGLGLSFAFTKFATNADGTPIIALYIDSAFVIISGIIAVTASVFAALIPAIRSSRLSPIEIIRNN